MQDRELVSAPTKRPARNGHYSKTFIVPRVLTTACAWYGVHTPAHQVSKNRPKKSCSQITAFFYNWLDIHELMYHTCVDHVCSMRIMAMAKNNTLAGYIIFYFYIFVMRNVTPLYIQLH